MSRMKRLPIVLLLGFMLLLCGCSEKREIISSNNAAEMYENALAFYNEGDVDNATYQMALYLELKPTDVEAMQLIAQWYEELGMTAYAARYQKLAEQYTVKPLEGDLILSAENNTALVTELISSVTAEIQPAETRAEGVTIDIVGKNLFSGAYESGSYIGTAAPGWRTSEWFPLVNGAAALTISGGFNRAVWQFELISGETVTVGEPETAYRSASNGSVFNAVTATAAIPEGAVKARIAYAYEPDETSVTLDERVQIEYGSFPSDYTQHRAVKIDLPNLSPGSSLRCEAGVWTLSSSTEENTVNLPALDLRKGDTIVLSGVQPAVVALKFEAAEVNTNGVYGVKWSNADTGFLLERTDEAAGLSFNYMSGESWAGPFANDFDNIYPWSEIKLCAIDAEGKVRYEGQPGFKTDGSIGSVFVEIPKHYVRREVKDGTEYVAISAIPREGFVLDPSFQRENGEVSHIYVAAYPTSTASGVAASVSGEVPVIGASMDDARQMAAAFPNSSAEIDIFAVMTLQRLFMIETGLRNSQALWLGQAGRVYPYVCTEEQLAAKSAESANAISVADTEANQTFRVGDAVCITTVKQLESGKRYDNADTRRVTDVRKSGKRLSISFDGEPININEGETLIAHVTDVNGGAALTYHSGSAETNDGLTAFRYRYLENLWGGGFACVTGVSLNGQTLTVTYPDGHESELSYPVGIEINEPIESDYAFQNIVSFGYDANNPLVMLPNATGAAFSAGYGDGLYTDIANGKKTRAEVLLWGGTWDQTSAGGLFCYRFVAKDNTGLLESHSRSICWTVDAE